jgi:hypothetical protein
MICDGAKTLIFARELRTIERLYQAVDVIGVSGRWRATCGCNSSVTLLSLHQLRLFQAVDVIVVSGGWYGCLSVVTCLVTAISSGADVVRVVTPWTCPT